MSSNTYYHVQRDLVKELKAIEGCESLIGDAFDYIRRQGISFAKAGANKTLDVAANGLSKANTELIKIIGSRRQFVSHLYNKAKKENRVQIDMTFPKSVIKTITRDGNPDDIVPSVDVMYRNLERVIKFGKELEGYYQKELSLLKDITKIKDTESAVALIRKLEDLELPKVDLKSNGNSMSNTEELPGGFVLSYNEKTANWQVVHDEDYSTTEIEDEYRVSDIVSALHKLNDLLSLSQEASKINESYLKYLKSFNTVVTKSFQHLDSLKGEISTSLLHDLEDRLNGNRTAFSFFFGSLPRVMVRLDDYVDTLSSHFSKQFN
ncbi:hypothetical protein D5W64_12995 [Salmonella enterica subsp. enterica serovar Saintpaul]|nr:hypothetical protein [Salmonella enterica subsp. enterica serovar Saintpaul]